MKLVVSEQEGGVQYVSVGQDSRLNNRVVLILRTLSLYGGFPVEMKYSVMVYIWLHTSLTFQHDVQVVKCLLIEPFPESALNEEAGKMLMEDSVYSVYGVCMMKLWKLPIMFNYVRACEAIVDINTSNLSNQMQFVKSRVLGAYVTRIFRFMRDSMNVNKSSMIGNFHKNDFHKRCPILGDHNCC